MFFCFFKYSSYFVCYNFILFQKSQVLADFQVALARIEEVELKMFD